MSEYLKPCPFCGCIPEKSGRMLRRDNNGAIDSVTHPVTGECALDMLLFRLDEWNHRHAASAEKATSTTNDSPNREER